MNNTDSFGELPQSLVIDVLEQTEGIEQQLLQSFEDLRIRKEEYREKLVEKGMLKLDSNLPVARNPTTCGVDGAYAVENLLSTDLVVTGAVAVEGFTPPSEKRYWPEPQHFVHIGIEPRNEGTISIFRAAMIGSELLLARQAPHDLVLLDGSLTTPLIYFNQGFTKAIDFPTFKTKEWLAKKVKPFLDAYHHILSPKRNDHQWIAVPKYTNRQEIGKQLELDPPYDAYDDRYLLSSVLEAGEYTHPIELLQPEKDWNLNISVVDEFFTHAELVEIGRLKDQVLQSLKHIYVLYYRPRPYLPALRLEMSKNIANNLPRLSIVLQGIKDQYSKASIMEPYPLYMADRMVKHLPQALPACRHRISQHIAENYRGTIDDVFVGIHSYRTEHGR